jgi:hypothetical protein
MSAFLSFAADVAGVPPVRIDGINPFAQCAEMRSANL